MMVSIWEAQMAAESQQKHLSWLFLQMCEFIAWGTHKN